MKSGNRQSAIGNRQAHRRPKFNALAEYRMLIAAEQSA